MSNSIGRQIVILALGLNSAACGDNVGGLAPDGPDAAVASDVAALHEPDGPPMIDGSTTVEPIEPDPDTSIACTAPWHDVQLGTASDDQVLGLATDALGRIYVAGFERGVTGVTNIEPDGDSRGVVLRLDWSGTQQWKAVLDTSGTDTVEDVDVDASTGTIYALGRTSGAFTGFANAGMFDTVLASFARDGTMLRTFQTGDERPQHPLRLALGDDHQVALAGYDDTYIPSNFVESWEDGFVASLTATAAAPAFSQTFLEKVPLAPPSRRTDVAVDHDGSGAFYVTTHLGGPSPNVGIYVSKLTRTGTILWTTHITNAFVDAVNAVALSPDNELFVAGATVLSLTGTNAGVQDAFLLKLDRATGSLVWVAQAGSSASDYPTGLGFDEGGNIYVGGETFGAVVRGRHRGGLDAFALKFDPSGALLGSWQAGTTADDFVTGLVVNRCGDVLVGGHTRGSLVEGSTPQGGDDMFVVRAF